MEEGVRTRAVYLPAQAAWTDAYTKKTYEGGQTVTVPAPIDIIPVFLRDGAAYEIYE
jgi:alpha-D-xyloside xylohydrolase